MRWIKEEQEGDCEVWTYRDRGRADAAREKLGCVVGRGVSWRWSVGAGPEEWPLFGGERQDLGVAKSAVELHARLFAPILRAAWVQLAGDRLELALDGRVLATVEWDDWSIRWHAPEAGAGGLSITRVDACRAAAKEAALHRNRRPPA